MTTQDSHATRTLRTLASLLLTLAPAAVGTPAQGQEVAGGSTVVEGVDYVVYDRSGGVSTLADIVQAGRGSDVLLVGEEHDDMPGHAFEAALLEATMARGGGRPVVLSLEMFERDVQYVLDEYLADEITETHFLASARPWDDYEARYRPLVEMAKLHGSAVVAANAPRRYVNRVTRLGPESLSSLSESAKRYLPPLPYPGPSDRYRAQWDALMASAMRETPDSARSTGDTSATAPAPRPAETTDSARSGPDHSMSSNAIYSQALWDASMGHAVSTALVAHLGALVVHFAGSFHVARGTGIEERIRDYRPGTQVTTVVITKVEDIGSWSVEDHAGLADFVVLTPQPERSTESEQR